MYRVITIMADFGNGPYAWGKDLANINDSIVGRNIADAVAGFEPEYNIPEELQYRFCDWMRKFESDCDRLDFKRVQM